MTIFLPRSQISPGLAQAAKEAINKYCQFKIRQGSNEKTALRREGLKALRDGLVFLAICLFLSALFGKVVLPSEFPIRYLSEGLLIFGWVSLWRPIEILVYDWWPYARNNRIYENIMDMEILIQPQE